MVCTADKRSISDLLQLSAAEQWCMLRAADGAPQTFLLTPKLLSGLNFNEHIVVHDIFNGPNIGAISKARVHCGRPI